MAAFKSRTVSISINLPAFEVYEFASDPDNLPKWAAGLAGSVVSIDGDWIIESPMGRISVAFVPRNEYGVLDHHVTLPSDEVVYNPLRIFPNNDGAEVIFTLYQRDGMTDAEFEQDEAAVLADLDTLKALLEPTYSA